MNAAHTLGARLRRVPVRPLVLLLVLGLVLGGLMYLTRESPQKTVTAHFPRAVSTYVGTDVRILGVNVGRVTAVVPEGNSVRVEMTYDATYDVPADAQAVIVTPTLVSDRFVQLTPAYTGGEVLADGADIALPDTGVPVELDRIYRALRDLTVTLGPNGVNTDGTLDNTLSAAREAFEGNGALGNEMIRNLSDAAVTFGEGSGDLFATVRNLAEFTEVLAANDAVVRGFIQDLAAVSAALADERQELVAALEAVGDAVGTVETFVRSNRQALVTDIEKLTRVLKTINSERKSIDTALTVAPVAIGNLVLAFDVESGSIGSRIGVQQNVWDLDGFLCAVVQQSDMPDLSKDLACNLFTEIIDNRGADRASVRRALAQARAEAARPEAERDDRSTSVQEAYASDVAPTVESLFGGGQ